MKENVTETMFIDGFREANRENNFSYYGRKALYEYLTDLEEDAGIEIEFDPIGLCCEYSEYESIEEVRQNYTNILDLEDLRDHTEVIEFSEWDMKDGKFQSTEGRLIILDF